MKRFNNLVVLLPRSMKNERGGWAPIAMVSAVIFLLVLGTAVSSASNGARVASAISVNTQLNQLIQTRANQVAASGYTQVSSLPATQTVNLSVGTGNVTAIQAITQNSNGTASIIVAAGKYETGGVVAASSCSLNPSTKSPTCLYAEAIATQDISTAAPLPSTFTPQSPAITTTARTKFTDVSAGDNHSLAIDSTGQVWAWGGNDYCQLGTGTNTASTNPIKTFTGITAKKVAAGPSISFVIDTAGNLWSVGTNIYGQAGVNSPAPLICTPTKVMSGTVFTQVVASAAPINSGAPATVWAVTSTGQAYGWGRSAGTTAGAALGDGNTVFTRAPTPIFPGVTVRSISAGYNTAAAIDTAGNLYSWGYGGTSALGTGSTTSALLPVQLGRGTTWKSVSAGFDHMCAIDTYSWMWCWGTNDTGQVGDAGTTLKPVPVRVAGSTRFQSVSAGYKATIAIDTTGQAWAWGSGAGGALGLGDTANRLSPVAVAVGAKFIAAQLNKPTPGLNPAMGVALDTSHYLWIWGTTTRGGLGDGSTSNTRTTATRVDFGPPVVTKVVSGALTTFAIDWAGNLWAWGDVSSGELGNGTAGSCTASWLYGADCAGLTQTTPVKVKAGTVFSNIFVTGNSVMAIDSAGNLWAWGDNTYGQLGNGYQPKDNCTLFSTNGCTAVIVSTPVQITSGIVITTALPGTASQPSYAIDSALKMYSWGQNYSGIRFPSAPAFVNPAPGAIFGGYWPAVTTPTVVLTNITEYKLVGYVTYALDASGYLWAWGAGNYGILGRGGDANSNQPTRVTTSFTLQSLQDTVFFTDGSKVKAIDRSGNIWVWGMNGQTPCLSFDAYWNCTNSVTTYGYIGLGRSTMLQYTPTRLLTVSSATQLVSWGALSTSGQIWAWGQFIDPSSGTAFVYETPKAMASAVSFTKNYASSRFFGDAAGNLWNIYPSFTSTTISANPTQIKPGTQFTNVSWAASNFTATDTSGGTWSMDGDGQSLQAIPSAAPITSITAGFDSAYGINYYSIDNTGLLSAWGSNGNGLLGIGNTTAQSQPVSVLFPGQIFRTVSTTAATATVWSLGTFAIAGAENFQVDVQTEYPIAGIGLFCPATGQKLVSAAQVQTGSGSWKFGNVLAGDANASGALSANSCPANPQIVVYLEGEPIATTEVQTRVMRLVNTTK